MKEKNTALLLTKSLLKYLPNFALLMSLASFFSNDKFYTNKMQRDISILRSKLLDSLNKANKTHQAHVLFGSLKMVFLNKTLEQKLFFSIFSTITFKTYTHV